MITLSLVIVVSSVGLALSSSGSFLSVWLMMELNLVGFLMFLFFHLPSRASLMKYFVAQSVGSLMLLNGAFWSGAMGTLGVGQWLVIASLTLKSGMAPFHWWLIRLTEELSWESMVLLFSIQKVIPVFLFFKSGGFLWELAAVNTLVGALGVFSQKRFTKFLGYFSLVSSSWLIVSYPNLKLSLAYLATFTLGMLLLLSMSGLTTPKLAENKMGGSAVNSRWLTSSGALSLAGFPPLLGFYLKVKILNSSFHFVGGLAPMGLLAVSPLILFSLVGFMLPDWKLASFGVEEGNSGGSAPWLGSVGLFLWLGGLSVLLPVSNCA